MMSVQRKTIECAQSWAGKRYTYNVIGKREVKLNCGETVVWYKTDGPSNWGWVSVPFRLTLARRTIFFSTGFIRELKTHMDCYNYCINEPNRTQFSDITPEEEELAAKLVMMYQMGIR